VGSFSTSFPFSSSSLLPRKQKADQRRSKGSDKKDPKDPKDPKGVDIEEFFAKEANNPAKESEIQGHPATSTVWKGATLLREEAEEISRMHETCAGGWEGFNDSLGATLQSLAAEMWELESEMTQLDTVEKNLGAQEEQKQHFTERNADLLKKFNALEQRRSTDLKYFVENVFHLDVTMNERAEFST